MEAERNCEFSQLMYPNIAPPGEWNANIEVWIQISGDIQKQTTE